MEFLKAFHQDENYLAYCDPPNLPGAAGAVQRYPSARKSINAKMAWLKTEPLMKEWMTWMDWGWAGMQMHLEYGQILKDAFLPATAQALEGTASDRPVLDEAARWPTRSPTARWPTSRSGRRTGRGPRRR